MYGVLGVAGRGSGRGAITFTNGGGLRLFRRLSLAQTRKITPISVSTGLATSQAGEQSLI